MALRKTLNVDFFLPFFGLSTDLGPIKDWELDLEKEFTYCESI